MAGEGALLRSAREEKGWTYHDVEEILKIRVRYLEALENEEYSIIPGNTYSKGFLRTYAKHLGLNPQEIIDLYNSSLQIESTPDTNKPLTPIQSTPIWFKPIVLVVMALIAAVIVIGITYYSKLNNNPPIGDFTPAPLPTTPQTQAPPDDGQKPSGTSESPTAPESPADKEDSPEDQPPIIYEGIVVELTFQEDCWLKVRVDGEIVQDGMSGSGTVKVFQGTKRIEFLTIGNAGGVTMKLNGKVLPPLGASREVIRNYVVTEETVENL